MATWVNPINTSTGGNVPMNISGGYNVSRDGTQVTIDFGVRFQATQYYTYNSIAAFYNGDRRYALKTWDSNCTSGTWEWLYATSGNNDLQKRYTSEYLPYSVRFTASTPSSGTYTINVGTAWNNFTPTSSKYSYSFDVPYPAAASYSITYNANGGSGVPSSQTKYKGYSLTLSTATPTRSGYRFDGWATSSSGSAAYQPGDSYTADSGATLYAVWTPTNPIFTAPTLSATETTISWPSFSANTSSTFYYQVDGQNASAWIELNTGISANLKTLTGLNPGEIHTVYFRAVNTADSSAQTIHSSNITLYNYPYIISLGKETIEVGRNQTLNLYNPLGRTVTLKYQTSNYSGTLSTTSNGSISMPISLDVANDTSKDSNRSCPIQYQSVYNIPSGSQHTSTKTGTAILLEGDGQPQIDTSKQLSFIEIGDDGTFKLNNLNYQISEATGNNILVQGKSKLKYKLLSANNPFSPRYGATIVSYNVKINSKEKTVANLGTQYYEGASSGTSSSNDVVTLSSLNNYKIAISAVDNRGFTSEYEVTMATQSYSSPILSAPSISRIGGYGDATILSIVGSWSPGFTGKHIAKTIKLYYKPLGDGGVYSSYVLYNNTGNATQYKSLSGTEELGGIIAFDSQTAYDIFIEAEDCFGGRTQSPHNSLPLGIPLLMIDSYQEGLGINCFPEGRGIYMEDGTTSLKGKISLVDTDTVSSWVTGRDRAAIVMKRMNDRSPLASMKSYSGDWQIGTYSVTDNDNLYFTFISDTNYNSNTNSPQQVIIKKPSSGNRTIGFTFSGTAEPSSSLGDDGDIYIRYN